MGDNPQTNDKQNLDEIDLGQLMAMIKRASNRLFTFFLAAFVYLKKNVYIIGGLILVGVLCGFLANLIFEKKLETEVIVKANFESKDYLYDAVSEIEANLKAKDSLFFTGIGITPESIKGFEIFVEPVQEEAKEEAWQEEDGL